MEGQFEIIWPSKLQGAAQQDTRKPKLFGGVCFQQTQHKSSSSHPLAGNSDAASWDQAKAGCLAREVGLLAGKQASLKAKGRRNWGIKNDEAASSYQHLLLTAGKIEEWP